MRGSYSSAVLAAATPREAKRLKLSYVPKRKQIINTFPFEAAAKLAAFNVKSFGYKTFEIINNSVTWIV
ncbi:Uncharacterised protein [Vibrio cholerae]|nr:Uncharacterised protein [Vibrio cholerae]